MEVLELLVGKLLRNGKRSQAERIVVETFKELEENYGIKNPLEVLLIAIENVAPLVEIKVKRVGGIKYKIPKDINTRRSISLSISWLIDSVKQSKGTKLSKRLAREIILASKGEGKAVERVRDLHEYAKKNRGLIKYL